MDTFEQIRLAACDKRSAAPLRRAGPDSETKNRYHPFVRQVTHQAEEIRSFEVVDTKYCRLPPFTAGAHVDLYFGDGRVRQYSLCNDPAEKGRYVFAVLRIPDGRGGSQAIFDRVHVGRTITIGPPRNMFSLHEEAEHHLLLAGGIGITPMMAMMYRLRSIGADYTMHYCTKSPKHTPLLAEIKDLIEEGRMFLHHDGGDPSRGLDIPGLLKGHGRGTHLYYCGPEGFMAAATKGSAHWPSGSVHREYFEGPALPQYALPGQPRTNHDIGVGFRLRIASTGATLDVPEDKSVVEVLEENGLQLEVSCSSGLCGSCKTRYLSGEVAHRDLILSEEERAEYLTPCVSRAKSRVLVLDL